MRLNIKAIGILLISVALALLLTGCSTSGRAPKVLKVDEKNNGSSVQLAKGELLEVRLAGNPTTGYQWMLKTVDKTILNPLGEAEYNPDSTATGSGGLYTFRMEAVSPGETRLEFVYRRSFEPETEKPADAFSVTVKVE